MQSFEDSLLIKGDLGQVYQAFYDIEQWPKFTPHVTAIEMLETNGITQRLMMHVHSNGRDHVMETVRRCEKDRRISYHQTKPPALFRRHHGEWLFEAVPAGVLVKIVHHAEINPESIQSVLGVDSMEAAAGKVREVLSKNSLQTMRAIKSAIEGGQAVTTNE